MIPKNEAEKLVAALLPVLQDVNPPDSPWETDDLPVLLPFFARILANSDPEVTHLSNLELAQALLKARMKKADRLQIMGLKLNPKFSSGPARFLLLYLRRHRWYIGWLWAKDKYRPPYSVIDNEWLER